jgi:hypothetical protein
MVVFSDINWLQVFELVMKGPSGWLPLVIGGVVTWLAGRRHGKKSRMPRAKTFAYIGCDGKIDAQTAGEVAARFAVFSELETEVREIGDVMQKNGNSMSRNVAEWTLDVAAKMKAECDELSRLNIAFPKSTDHRQFMARIDERRGRAQRLRHVATIARTKPAPRMAAE